jgi:hypothetical protein
MAQELHPTLAAAMESIDRRPIVRVTSDALVSEIPFPGIPQAPLPVTTEIWYGYPMLGYEEVNPVAISLSNGEAAYVSIYGSVWSLGGNRHMEIRLVTTTGGRTVFNTPVVLELNKLWESQEQQNSERWVLPNDTFDSQIGIAELANGNLGLTWLDSYTLYLQKDVCFHAAEITTDGVQVYPTALPVKLWNGSIKETYADTGIYYWSGPSTIRLANGTYLSVFVHRFGGTNYTVWKKTSSDFRTWAARSEIVLSGIPTTKQISNPFLKQLPNGDVFLFFDLTESLGASGERLRNLYYVVSTDSGSTWGTPQKITNYSEYSSVAMHPEVFQRTANQLTMVFTELLSVMHLGEGSVGWTVDDDVDSLSWDPVNRKLYVLNQWQEMGSKYLQGVVKIDVDTWSIDRQWTHLTTPGFPTQYGTGWDDCQHYRHLIVVRHVNGCSVLDGEANTITDYNFDNYSPYGLEKNVTGWDYFSVVGAPQIPRRFMIEGVSMRLYFLSSDSYTHRRQCGVGFIDLTDPGPEYGAETVFYDRAWFPDTYQAASLTHFLVSPSLDMVLISHSWSPLTIEGGLIVYKLSTGGFLKWWTHSTNQRFPYWGLIDFTVRGNKVYGGVTYTTLYGNQDYRGVLEIDPLTGICNYFRPSYATVDDYNLRTPLVLSTGEILWGGWGTDGVVLWNPDTSLWARFTRANTPGLPVDTWTGTVMMDEATGMIFAAGNPDLGVWAFSRYGYLYRTKYVDANFTTDWEWGDPEILTQNWSSYNATPAYLPSDNTMMLFWQEGISPGGRTILWGNDFGELDASPFLARGHDISLSRSIDGKPSAVEFTCINGHLFDPTNRGSIWQGFFRKGRKITLAFGERIDGADYWVNQGSFLVTETEVNHRRGEYPTIRIKAEDMRVLWEEMEITATMNYQASPEDIVRDILHDYMGMEYSDIVLGTFRWTYEVWIQWLDTTIKKMLEQIGNRFGYAFVIDPAGRVVAKKIAWDNPVDHAYADVSKVADWSPDDSFSDMTNRIVVHGETRDFMEVMYEEELITSLVGTVGFWGHKQTQRVYFSEDNSRTCRYPRLNVVESVKNFNFRLGGGGESISYIDPDGKYIDVTIEMPDFTGFIIADVTSLLALGVAAIAYSGGLYGTPGWITFGITILLAALFYFVASIAQYQYEVYARPIGLERMSIQSASPHGEDLVLQNDLGRVVEKKIDEPLCISVAQCNEYSDYEIGICKYQRNRVNYAKIAHLQDDEGDTLQLPQPYSGITTKVFVTDIKRKMKIPSDPESMDGYFLDEIEGWVVS